MLVQVHVQDATQVSKANQVQVHVRRATRVCLAAHPQAAAPLVKKESLALRSLENLLFM